MSAVGCAHLQDNSGEKEAGVRCEYIKVVGSRLPKRVCSTPSSTEKAERADER